MKVLIVTVCAFVVAFAAPAQRTAQELAAIRALPAMEHNEVHDEFGQYALRYVTAEGIVVSQRGRLVPNNEGDGYVLITEGEVSYIGEDGEVYSTKFTAGLDGTKVEGNHLPVAPASVVPNIPEVHEVPNSKPFTTVRKTVPLNYLNFAAIRALPALVHDVVHDEYEQYAWRYVTAEAIVVSQRGRLVPNNEGDGYVLITEGEVSYIGDDGKVYSTKFSAGLDGTKVVGNYMPVAPETIIPNVAEDHEVLNS